MGNALFYTCSLIEFIGRRQKQKRAYIVNTLGKSVVKRIYTHSDVLHCELIDSVAEEFIKLILTPGGKAKTVYSADNFRIVYSDIQFLMIFVYWTIQFNFMMYNIDYFKRDDSSSEVEFLLEKECSVVPVEVKANKGGTSSLDSLLKKNEIKYGYKIINCNVGQLGKKITIPHYMCIFL